ncbi:histidine phosphatase family protein [bacterium]|nr:MAG: histidine phosphatase family protein [bacterium]RIK63714.1 MAG: histidine phosphatase family protein [Planctomycetota bacterium]
MTTTIILVRHGETQWNREGRYQGKLDIPLNDNGREQARRLALGLAAVGLDAAYASHLARAQETARMVCEERKLEVTALPGLAEINHGDWEGKLASEVEQTWPNEFDAWKHWPHTVQMPGGERLSEVQARAVAALTAIAEKHAGQTLLVAAHDATNKTLLCWASEAPLSSFWRFKQDPTAVNCLEVSRVRDLWVPRIVLMNSVQHTGALISGIVHKAL